MALSQFYMNGPYVHSHLFNFRKEEHDAVVKENILTDEYFQTSITRLQNLSKALKEEADAFLGGKDIKTVSNELFFNEKTYSGLSMKILRSKEFLDIVTFHSIIDWTNPDFIKFYEDKMLDGWDEILKSQDVSKLAFAIVNQSFGKNHQGTYKASTLFSEQNFKEFEHLMQDKWVYRTKREGIEREVTKLIKKHSTENYGSNWLPIYEYFEKQFWILVKQQKTFTSQGTPEAFLQRVKNNFQEVLKNAYTGDVSNATGVISEEIKSAVFKADTLTWKFENTGSMTETEIVKKFGSAIEKIDWKNVDKKSPSDWIITNPETGKTVRAQDKNSIMMLEELRNNASSTRPQILKLQEGITYLELKSKLQQYGGNSITDTDWKLLEYLISNLVWFSIRENKVHENMQDENGKLPNTNRTKMGGIQEDINRILSQNIGFFVSVTINEWTAESLKWKPNASNIFFIIDNAFLFPTYKIIDSIILKLQSEKNNADARLYATISRTGYSGIVNSDLFYDAKLAQMKLHPNWKRGDAYNSNILSIGQSVGQSIIQQAKLERVNLKLDLQSILTSAYNIDITAL